MVEKIYKYIKKIYEYIVNIIIIYKVMNKINLYIKKIYEFIINNKLNLDIKKIYEFIIKSKIYKDIKKIYEFIIKSKIYKDIKKIYEFVINSKIYINIYKFYIYIMYTLLPPKLDIMRIKYILYIEQIYYSSLIYYFHKRLYFKRLSVLSRKPKKLLFYSINYTLDLFNHIWSNHLIKLPGNLSNLVNYIISIFNRSHFRYLYKTLRKDWRRLKSYFIITIDEPSKWKYRFRLFKRLVKAIIWFNLIALHPRFLIKIIWIIPFKHLIKYFYIILDIIVYDILIEIVDISFLYDTPRDRTKYILLDLPFYDIPSYLKKIFGWKNVKRLLIIAFFKIENKIYNMLAIILLSIWRFMSNTWRFITRSAIYIYTKSKLIYKLGFRGTISLIINSAIRYYLNKKLRLYKFIKNKRKSLIRYFYYILKWSYYYLIMIIWGKLKYNICYLWIKLKKLKLFYYKLRFLFGYRVFVVKGGINTKVRKKKKYLTLTQRKRLIYLKFMLFCYKFRFIALYFYEPTIVKNILIDSLKILYHAIKSFLVIDIKYIIWYILFFTRGLNDRCKVIYIRLQIFRIKAPHLLRVTWITKKHNFNKWWISYLLKKIEDIIDYFDRLSRKFDGHVSYSDRVYDYFENLNDKYGWDHKVDLIIHTKNKIRNKIIIKNKIKQ